MKSPDPTVDPETTKYTETTQRVTVESPARTTQPPTPNSPREQLTEFDDERGVRHRIRFVPRGADEWWCLKEVWSGQQWQHVNQYLITDLEQWSRPVDEVERQ